MTQAAGQKSSMGFWTCSALVVGNMVGSGVFLLPASLAASRAGRALFVPQENAIEAALPQAAEVYAAAHLLEVCAHLRGITPMLPAIEPAVDRFATRLEALAARGIAVDSLAFEASLGRTSMEYYDGFVFSFHGPDGTPPLASGGRYDALTAVLGQGRSIPAVGGVIRPQLVAGLRKLCEGAI